MRGQRGRGFIHSRIGEHSMKLDQAFMACAGNGVGERGSEKGTRALCVTVEFHLMQFSLPYCRECLRQSSTVHLVVLRLLLIFVSWMGQDAARGWNCP